MLEVAKHCTINQYAEDITIFVCLSNKNPDAVGSALEGDLEEYLVGLQVSRMGATTRRQLSTPPLTQTQLGLLPFKT